MQSVFFSTAYANDSEHVIYIFYRSCVEVNTQRSCVKNEIHRNYCQ